MTTTGSPAKNTRTRWGRRRCTQPNGTGALKQRSSGDGASCSSAANGPPYPRRRRTGFTTARGTKSSESLGGSKPPFSPIHLACLAPGGEASWPPQRWRGEPRSKQIGTSAHGSGFGKPVVAAVFVLHEEAGRATFAAAGSCRTWGDDAEAWHAVRGSDPLKPTEETAMARMKIAIVATCKRLGVNQRTRRTRIPARAPLAPDIASNAHPAHMVAGYQQSETTMRLPGAVQSNSPCVPATRR